MELASLLSGEYDHNDAVASLHAGAGGVDSQDWTDMLLRMYLRWAEREGLDAELDEVLPGEEAGVKSAVLTVKGPNAYGLLSAERGVHRLVRLSPYDSAHRRHTSFASLDVIPLLDEAAEEDVEIDPKDLRIDIYRSTRAGRAVRQHHRLGGPHHPPPDRDHRRVSERAVPAPEPGRGHAHPQGPPRRADAAGARGEGRVAAGTAVGERVRLADPVVRAAPVPTGEGPPDGVEVGNVDAVLDGDIDRLIEAELRRRATPDEASA